MNEFYARYRVAEKDLQIATMKLEQQHTRQIWLMAVGGSVLIVIVLSMLALYQRMKRISKEKEAADLHIRIRQKEQEFERMEKEMHTHILHSYFKGTEAERKRLAKELHDNVANELMGISMLMKIRPEAGEETAGHLKKLYEEVRAISHDLMPPIFRQVTLTEILEAHVSKLNMRKILAHALCVGNASENLSSREIEVLHLIAQGLSTREIAEQLCLSINTIESHRKNLFVKLGAKNSVDLVMKAINKGMYNLLEGSV